MKKIVFACSLFLSAAASAASVPCPCTFRQNWPWDARLFIDATLPEGTNDLTLAASFAHDGARVALELSPATGLTGDSVYNCTNGVRRYVWDPAKAGYPKVLADFTLTASAEPVSDRTWLVVDMATGQTAYYADDAAPRDAETGWPWQDDVYKTKKMVFRRIPAGTFTMGYTDEQIAWLKERSPTPVGRVLLKTHQPTLTSDFYLAIYPLTYGQIRRLQNPASLDNGTVGWVGDKNVTGGGAVCFQRGSNAVEGVSWPETKFRVSPGSWVAKFRARCGKRFMVDLPTAAQWQRAMRPDPTWLWYDTPAHGGGAVGDSATTITNVLDAISQIPARLASGTALYSTPESVGLKQPNALGFYDGVGARPELLLDQYNWKAEDYSAEAVDPVGPTSNKERRAMANSFVAAKSLAQWSLASLVGATTDHDLDSNTEHCIRYAIHLAPPASFGGEWE